MPSFSKYFQKVFMIAQTMKTSCEDLIFITDNLLRGVIPKCLSVGNTNIFGVMKIIAKIISNVLCYFFCVISRSKSLNLIFMALGLCIYPISH